jgi:hypothetical protein
MDHGFTRAKEPWECSDGAIYLLRELSAVKPELTLKYMTKVRRGSLINF